LPCAKFKDEFAKIDSEFCLPTTKYVA
jgi:hypothetical protein